jgi:hypothetical protein
MHCLMVPYTLVFFMLFLIVSTKTLKENLMKLGDSGMQ